MPRARVSFWSQAPHQTREYWLNLGRRRELSSGQETRRTTDPAGAVPVKRLWTSFSFSLYVLRGKQKDKE